VVDFMQVSTLPNGQTELVAIEPDAARLDALVHGGRPKQPEIEGEPILEVKDLRVAYPGAGGLFRKAPPFVAVDGVSLRVGRGQTLGLVGESGCGKTTTGRAILRLIEPTGGSVRFLGRDFLALRGEELRQARRQIQVVFQDPYSSLNPRMTVGETLTEPMEVHGVGLDATERRDRAASLLREVGLNEDHLRRYPHEFSGGQRQRICIARALATEPSLVICDESVSALDVSVQAQVLNLLKDLQEKRGLAYIFISHDLSVVKFMSDTMIVMERGRVVEAGPADEVYAHPREAYTQRLIAAIPNDDLAHVRGRQAQRVEAAARRSTATRT
jgi:peptide/nickel transport system ATP-binding protein